MMKRKRINFLMLCIALVLILSSCSNKGKLAWVNITEIYNEFHYKKELEKKLTETQQARKKVLDSLELDLKMLSREIQSEGGKSKDKISLFEVKRENYLGKKDQLDEDNAVLERQYNEQILNQLNQYLKDYGKEKGLRYIFGTSGTGSLMYAEEADEITKDVIVYINEKYKGKTK